MKKNHLIGSRIASIIHRIRTAEDKHAVDYAIEGLSRLLRGR